MWRSLSSRLRTPRLQLLQVTIPVLALLVAGILAVWAWRAERDTAEQIVLRNARLAAAYSERVLTSLDQLLVQAEKLASPERLRLDRKGLAAELATLVETGEHAISVSIVTPDGQLLLTDRWAGPTLDVSDRPYFQALRDGDETLYIDRLTVQPAGEDAIVVARRRAGEGFAGLVVTGARVAAFADFFRTMASPDDAAVSLIRRDGRLLVRQDTAYPPLTIESPAAVLDAIAGTAPPLYEATAQTDGITRLYATVPVQGFPLFASFGLPTRAIWVAWGWRMLVIVASLAAAVAIALLVLGELSRRLQHALDAAEVARSRAAADRQAMLYQELSHRVKNNLQLVESLLRLRGRGQTGDSRDSLDEVALRVNAIAEVHRQLDSASGDGTVDIARLLRRLTTNPGIVPPERDIEVSCSTDALELAPDRAIPLALITVEALTNAVKHAFPGDRSGTDSRIDVTLRTDGITAALSISDNGVGSNGSPRTDQGLGLRLLAALASQLGGALDQRFDGGTTLSVTFPVQPGPQAPEAPAA